MLLKNMKNEVKFIDLFAGIGGFHYALKSIMNEKQIPHTLVMASEIDNFAKIAYSKNHGIHIGDIKNIKEYVLDSNLLKNLGNIDLIMGGFPCQPFSNAGKKNGFLDKVRGTLFYDIVEIIKDKNPKYILLENVRYIHSHDNGNTWKLIKETMEELGYWMLDNPIILSPHEFGIPQTRWRAFMPAIRKDSFPSREKFLLAFNFDSEKIKNILPFEFNSNVDESDFLQDEKVLKALEAWGEFIKKVKRPPGRTLPVIWLEYLNGEEIDLSQFSKWKAKYISDMKKCYLDNKEFIDAWKIKHNVSTWKKRESKLEWQAGINNRDYKDSFVQLRQSGIRFKSPQIFPTLVAMVQTSILFDKKYKKWRYLSLDEVRKLQSFPKEFDFETVPKFQAYKQFGNAINVEVVKKVLGRLMEL